MTLTTTDQRAHLTPEIIAALAAAMRGPLVQPGDPSYDEARAVYNAMIDKRPALIAQCADVADVITVVNAAREHGLLLAVRGGGHSGAGLGAVDDGIVLDLALMRGVRVDPEARTVRVEGGALLGDVHHATFPFGLVTPSGIIASTGVGGITLGGGLGYFTRAFGLGIDNLLEADVVLADGSFVTASPTQHPDLFWALRGGGGNFGVVTSFLLRLHPLEHLTAGPMLWPLSKADEMLRWYREYSPQAPDNVYAFFAFLTVPPAAPFPQELWGEQMCCLMWAIIGPPAAAEAVLAPVRQRFGAPALDWVGPMTNPALQSMFDALYPAGDQWYWKADFFEALSDAAIQAHLQHAPGMPTWKSTMHLYPIDGIAGRVPRDATAWNFRSANWAMVIVGVSPDPADTPELKRWARTYWRDLHPYSAGGAYVNMMMDGADEGRDRVSAAYGDHYQRLTQIKRAYDPGNLFQINQNIAPA